MRPSEGSARAVEPAVARAGLPATYALIGDPVARSVSPAMHTAAFAEVGLDARYVALNVGLRDLARAFPSLRRRFAGLNVTRPLKEAVRPLMDRTSPEVARTGSVNTVVMADGAAVGHSTDGAGFLAALARTGAAAPHRALILGTGGAARAVAAVLLDADAAVTVAGRNKNAGRLLAADLGARFLPCAFDRISRAVAEELIAADLLVNATPLGAPPYHDASPLPADVTLAPGLTVFDLVYRPRRTPLLGLAEAAGCRTVEGIEMLIEQGARSFELWTGLPAPMEPMREAAYGAVGRAVERTGSVRERSRQ